MTGRPAGRGGGLTSPTAATLRLDTSRDVTSRARTGGAGDSASKQMGLLELISASVLTLTGRARQKGRCGTTKSAFVHKTVLFPKPRRNGCINGQYTPAIRLLTA
jgi:hypothetical protein